MIAILVLLYAAAVSSFISNTRTGSYIRTCSTAEDIDPNFEAHLADLLNRGLEERPSPEVATDLRKRYKQIQSTKRRAAESIKTSNPELAAELEEIADELAETSEKFVEAAMFYDAWNRPSPDIAQKLRDFKELTTKPDPNYEAHKESLIAAGLSPDRTSPDLPSELRLLKYKQSASVNRIAAKEIRPVNKELAAEMDEIADELEESHERFVKMAESFAASKLSESAINEEE